jgi:peptide/nickel transport system substrate-binding protein
MKLLKKLITISLVCILLAAAASCGLYELPQGVEEPSVQDETEPTPTPTPRPTASPDDKFTLAYNPEASLNPYSVQSATNFWLTGLSYESLFKLNEDYSYEPVLCDGWETTDRGYSYLIDIKPGVMMHDGTEMSIFDVIYSVRLAKESERYKVRFKNVDSVGFLNGRVYITLDTPNTDFCALLDIPIVKDGTGYDRVPVGSGPYKFDTGLGRFVAFEGYRTYDTLPLREIYVAEYQRSEMMSAFERADIDLTVSQQSNISYVDYAGDCEVHFCPSTTIHYLGFNSRRGYCSDPLRRLILSSAVDREDLSGTVVAGTVTTALPVTPGSRWYIDSVAETALIKPELVETMMIRTFVEDYDQDGFLEYIEDSTVWDFALEFIVNNDNMQKVAAARKIASKLISMGFDVKLKEVDWNTFRTLLNIGEYDIYYGELQYGANFDLSPLFCYGGDGCYGFYDPDLQNYVYAFNFALEEEKEQAMTDLLVYQSDNCFIAPLFFERTSVYTKRGAVSNMYPNAHNIFANIAEWKVTFPASAGQR